MSDAFNDDGVNDEGEAVPAEPFPLDDTVASDSPEVDALVQEISADFTELELLTRERDDYLDALRRTQADFENYRKRMQREATEARDAGAAGLAAKLVDVLDTVDLALAHDPSDSVAQIATALVDVLGKEGLTRIDALGAPFDPEVHEAVLHEDGDGPAEVIEVLRSGWRWREKVLRAAMVKVKGS
ncbi:MAG: nucleotide exchange factor GrpE [Acidimicrobiales bacterium]|nr:nucleotide exchange factor GrpE [Acidimicrobiales bacterium]